MDSSTENNDYTQALYIKEALKDLDLLTARVEAVKREATSKEMSDELIKLYNDIIEMQNELNNDMQNKN